MVQSGESSDLPDFATHYFISSRAPFLNLSDLVGDELDRVLEALRAEHQAAQNLRRFGALYMSLRAETEQRLRRCVVAAGGTIHRDAPHYFTLGSSAWFAGLSPQMSSIEVPLAEFPSESTSVTWYDSFAAMGAGKDLGLPVAPPDLLGTVHRLEDVATLAAAHGLPSPDDQAPSDPMTAEHTFVEIQLWTDDPIGTWLASSGSRGG